MRTQTARHARPLLLLAIALTFLASLALPQLAHPQTPPAAPAVLQAGDSGPRVAALQWLLTGGRPSVYSGVRTLPRAGVDGVFGPATASAVVAMKRRLGFPDRALLPIAGRDLLDILTGKRGRPIGYITRATKRLAEDEQIAADAASTACAKRAIEIARGELGVHEIPDGSNDSPRIRVYQAVTGAFRAPWCASFSMWVMQQARIGFPKTAWSGAIADNSAGVFHIVDWARGHGWLMAIPKPAYLVAFTDRLGHIGIVERVDQTGFLSLEGNSGNAVRERWHPFGARPAVFIRVPGCAAG